MFIVLLIQPDYYFLYSSILLHMSIFAKLTRKIKKFKKFSDFKKNNIYVHPKSEIGSFTTIGQRSQINGPAFIASYEESPVIIGKYCAIAHNLRIRTRNHYTGYISMQRIFQGRHGFPELSQTKGPVIIGNAVWIGDNVTILPGAQIGDGAVVGAGAIVTKNIPPYAIAVGSPAKVIKMRFNEKIVKQLVDINWWDWTEDKIARNKAFFSTDFSKIKVEDDVNIYQIIVE